MENEGFNTQKNSGLNLEHAYSHTCWQALLFPATDRPPAVAAGGEGEPAAALAQEQGKRTAVELFGSLKNMALRFLESLRYVYWPEEAFDRWGQVASDPTGQQLGSRLAGRCVPG